jgi:hypothetical protein
MRWTGNGMRMGEEDCIEFIGAKPQRERPLVRPRSSWVNNIKIDLGEIR